MKRILLMGLALLALGLSTLTVGAPETVNAAPKDEICKGVSITGGTCEDESTGGLNAVIKNIINLFSILVGIIAVIMIMVSGYKYTTSGGDSGNVKSAKDTLVYAIVGILVVAFSQIIVQFVLKNAATTPKEEDKAPEASLTLPVAQRGHIENYYTTVL